MIRYLITVLLALAAVCAQAAAVLAEIPATGGDGPVTVYRPEAGRGNGRLIVISHGSGGTHRGHADLARALVEAGFTVAAPLHHADNTQDPSKPGPDSWKLRPAEVSRAIDAVAKDPRFAPALKLDKVGVYGMSAGGHTALSLAGGRWSPASFRKHCEAHLADDFPACVGLATRLRGDALDATKKAVALTVIRARFTDEAWHTHTDPRVAAIVAAVPFAADFDPASLAKPAVPLGFVTARHDKWLAPRFHSDRILAACKSCEWVADLPTGGHGALLSPPPPMDRLGEIAADLLGDPPGFDRAELPEVDRKIGGFFKRHLLP